jgi:RimJ/RimL family protein N-acetyltransferase
LQIPTPRLLLRDFTLEDVPAFQAQQMDARLAEFYGPGDVGADKARDLIGRFMEWAAEIPRENYQLAIAPLEDSTSLIGSCGVRLKGCEAGSAEFGLQLSPDHWGSGYATESARAILGFAFHDLGLREVRGVTVTQNLRVQRLVARLGFTVAETRLGPDWMQERGWSETVWRLGGEQWATCK